jgi:uncharacterized protein (TIGR01777 family)
MPTVLITGGTGLIGTHLTRLLQQRGYTVAYLTRSTPDHLPAGVRAYRWDYRAGTLDEAALRQADYLIHLAGAGVADGRWTEERRREIIESRTLTTQLLARKLREVPHRVQAFVCASAIGYYGADTGTEWISEQYTPGLDFLAEVTVAWEEAADAVAALGIRTVKLRTGIVLSTEGGALAKLLVPIRLGVGSPLGTGQQYQSWLHIDDMAGMYLEALENPTWSGAYNAVAPAPVTNAELTRTTAEVLGKPFWAPHVPAWALRALYGEMAVVVLGGNYILNQRIRLETDFEYRYPTLRPALEDLLKR